VELQNSGGQSFGDIDMTTALTNSVNTYWAQVGEQLGAETMVTYMERFGFYSDPELDYPSDQMAPSGVYNSDGDLVREGFDVGRVAIGQGGAEGQLLATATQMAEVAAAIGNGGVLMKPTFLQEAKDPDGRTIEELGGGDEQDRVISEESAAQLSEMMTNVTREGTAAGLSVAGVEFAGKTGTAEIDLEGTNQPWFIMFAPTQDPQIAVAATVERCQGCFGGEVAGPIATQVAESLLD
jgi:penicillin-binding protein A